MKIMVEFTGIAKSITNVHQLPLDLAENSSVDQVVGILGKKYTDLINVIIAPDGTSLLNSNVFFLNGNEMLMPETKETRFKEGDRLTLLSIIVGG